MRKQISLCFVLTLTLMATGCESVPVEVPQITEKIDPNTTELSKVVAESTKQESNTQAQSNTNKDETAPKVIKPEVSKTEDTVQLGGLKLVFNNAKTADEKYVMVNVTIENISDKDIAILENIKTSIKNQSGITSGTILDAGLKQVDDEEVVKEKEKKTYEIAFDTYKWPEHELVVKNLANNEQKIWKFKLKQ